MAITTQASGSERISPQQEDYLLGLIQTSGYRNTDHHDDFEREIMAGIDSERFEAIKSNLESNQIEPFDLGDSSQTAIKNHLKRL
jgi:hypothetical protein